MPAWVSLLIALASEALKQIQAGMAASKEEQEQLETRSKEALEALRGTRVAVTDDIEKRTEEFLEFLRQRQTRRDIAVKVKDMAEAAKKLD